MMQGAQGTARWRRQSGFTLIELLVALTLLALTSTMLFSGLRLGLRAWERSATVSGELTETQAAQGALRRLLAEARPIGAEAENGEFVPGFRGEEDRLVFVVALPGHLGSAGLHELTVATVDNDGLRSLVLTERPYGTPDMGQAEMDGHHVMLLSGVLAATFAYYGRPDGDESASWHATWNEAEMPDLVRVDVALGAGDGRRWPALIVAPRMRSGIS